MFSAAILRMDALMASHEGSGHGTRHCLRVAEHARLAVDHENCITNDTRAAVIMAALLHEVDDDKYFATENYQNARDILEEIMHLGQILESTWGQLVIEMISLVSCSKNGNSVVEPRWKLIPRDCDRLEAIGAEGIRRCWQYSQSIGRPLFLPETARAANVSDLSAIVTKERFSNYATSRARANTYGSATMIDHYYDKLLHYTPDTMLSNNSYVKEEAERRAAIMVDFVLYFGKTGELAPIPSER